MAEVDDLLIEFLQPEFLSTLELETLESKDFETF
jgi:hypothetical protein